MRIARTIAGFALLAAGIFMLAIPGPGLLTIAAALAILATDFEWARRLLDRVKSKASRRP
jgi:tellurite resistance protein TerC